MMNDHDLDFGLSGYWMDLGICSYHYFNSTIIAWYLFIGICISKENDNCTLIYPKILTFSKPSCQSFSHVVYI